MNSWITDRIDNANWLRFLIWFLLLMTFSAWAFNMDSPWTRALEAGGGKLPEMQPGFPPIEPQRSLDALGEKTGDYLLWQALDIPYAIFNFMVTSLAIALGLQSTGLAKTPTRFLLLLPALYVVCELIENSLVALFASKILAPIEPVVLIQQSATTLKLISGFGSTILGLIGLVAAIIAFAMGAIRKSA